MSDTPATTTFEQGSDGVWRAKPIDSSNLSEGEVRSMNDERARRRQARVDAAQRAVERKAAMARKAKDRAESQKGNAATRREYRSYERRMRDQYKADPASDRKFYSALGNWMQSSTATSPLGGYSVSRSSLRRKRRR